MTMNKKNLEFDDLLDQVDEISESRRQVEYYCQALVDAGAAQWHVTDAGDTELQLGTGEVYVFGDAGVTRRR